jgi:hypothetical protein
MEAKIRVMPTCWFLLTKFFVRIDNVIVRSRETRLFYEFDSSPKDPNPEKPFQHQIFMEVIWREKDLSANLEANANSLTANVSLPSTPAAYHTSLSSSHAMPPPPMMMKKYTKENTHEIPLVNPAEGIQQNYVIEI